MSTPFHSWKIYLITALLALGSGIFGLASCGIYPFGSTCFTHIDNLQLFAPDFGSINKILDGTDSPFFSFSAGGAARSSLLVTWHSLFFPITWIASLLPHTSIAQASSWSFLINYLFISLSALFYFKNTFRELKASSLVLLAMGYLLGSFAITKYAYIPFYHFMGIFPLFVYTLDRLLEKGKCWPYIAILTWMMTFATYYGYMFTLFAAIYAACFSSLKWSTTSENKTTYYLALLWSTLFAIIISCWSWLPSCVLTAESCRGEYANNYSWIRHGYIQWQHLSLWLCAPMAAAFILYARPKLTKCLHNKYFLTFCILAYSALFLCTYNLWHMGPPILFPGRYYFMIQLMALACGASYLQQSNMPAANGSYIKKLLLIGLPLIGLSILYLYPHLLSHDKLQEILWLLIVFIIIAGLRFFNHYIIAVFASLSIAALFSIEFRHNLETYQRREDSLQSLQLAEWADRQIPAAQIGARGKMLDHCINHNFSQYTQLDSISNFFHTASKEQQQTMRHMGYKPVFTRISDQGGTLFSDTLLGIRYIISNHPAYDNGLLPIIASRNSHRVYDNPYYWGYGFIAPTVPPIAPKQQNNPADIQNALASLILPGTRILNKTTHPVQKTDSETILQLPSNSGLDYICPQELGPYRIIGFKNRLGQPLPKREWDPWLTIDINEFVFFHIPVNATAIVLKKKFTDNHSTIPDTVPLYTLDQEAFRRTTATAAETAPRISYAGRTMELNCNNNQGTSAHLILPLLDNHHYSININGRSEQTTNCMGLLAIPLKHPGPQHILLTYTPPLQKQAIILTFTGGVIMLGIRYFLRKRTYPRLEQILRKSLLGYASLWIIYPTALCLLFYIGKIVAKLA